MKIADNSKMEKHIKFFVLIAIILAVISMTIFAAGSVDEEAEKDYAFFEGAERSYILGPPDRFQLVIDEAISDGYSFAFIPENQIYDTTTVRIAVHLMRVKEDGPSVSLEDFVHDDTLDLRDLYGQKITIEAVESMLNGSNELLPTIYFDDDSLFLPHVMNCYYSGGTEFLLFELTIKDGYPRFKAEASLVETILNFRTLPRGELGSLE